MRFAQSTYKAELENDTLRVDTIVLSTGYEADTEFLLTGGNKTMQIIVYVS